MMSNPGPQARSVAGRDVEDDDQPDDLAVADGEVVGEDELVRQVRLVEGAVVAAADNGVAVVLDDLGDVDGDVVAGHLLRYPSANGLGAPELAPGVVDQGVTGEGGHDGVGVAGVDGGDVLGDDGREAG